MPGENGVLEPGAEELNHGDGDQPGEHTSREYHSRRARADDVADAEVSGVMSAAKVAPVNQPGW